MLFVRAFILVETVEGLFRMLEGSLRIKILS